MLLKKYITIIISVALALYILTGCDATVDVSPKLQATSYELPTATVVTATLDGVATDFKVEVFNCNLDDLFLYRIADSAAILNADSTQVVCNPNSLVRFSITETNRPLFSDA